MIPANQPLLEHFPPRIEMDNSMHASVSPLRYIKIIRSTALLQKQLGQSQRFGVADAGTNLIIIRHLDELLS
jgi:hypothetical protein